MYFLIITFGFLLAMRGARPAPLQNPREGFRRVWRDAADFFLTTSLTLALWSLAAAFGPIEASVREYTILGPGIAVFLLSRYQKKTDVFFLSVLATVFMISATPHGFSREVFLAGVISSGIALFQTCLLGLRHKLLFSRVPVSAKGWPVLCLLAAFISLVLWSLRGLVF